MVRRMLSAVLLLVMVLAVGCQHVRLSGSSPLREKSAGAVRIGTWNVHYIVLFQEEGRWGISGWEARKAPMDATFKALDVDIIAFQEMESFFRGSDGSQNLARKYLLENNPDYAAAAIGPWQDFPTTQPIFYSTALLDLVDQGWFFFSETPEQIYSRGFDGASPSFASWAIFSHKSDGSVFRIINVHPDAFSRTNRRLAGGLIAERIRPWVEAGETVILAGDLNSLRGSRVHQMLEDAGLSFPPVHGATFHLDRGLHLFGAIDHIGLSDPALAASEPMVFRQKLGDVWPSDHHPVVLDVRFR